MNITRLESAQIKYNKLKNRLEKQAEIIKQLKYEANNPYIYWLCKSLELMDIVKICLQYLPNDYCVECGKFFPRNFKCIPCFNWCKEMSRIWYRNFEYKIYGSFTIEIKRCRLLINFQNEYDVIFFNNIKKFVNFFITLEVSNNSFYIDNSFKFSETIKYIENTERSTEYILYFRSQAGNVGTRYHIILRENKY